VTRTIVLFDIDGTLVHTLGAGVRGMNRAFERLHGRRGALDGLPIAGRTDRAIVGDAFARLAIEPTDDAVWALRDAYFSDLRQELARPGDGFFGVLPGVQDLLDRLEPRPEMAVGLLTGNFVGGAEIKLGHFDLWRRFGFGAFGDRHINRRDLVPVAREAARAAGLGDGPIVVIGDTPLDIDCAQANGARAVAVATGPYRADALAAADLVVETLEALTTEALLALTDGSGSAA
jgi:phosphoglycolate phosphatase-like HAD superfamily hydrolase